MLGKMQPRELEGGEGKFSTGDHERKQGHRQGGYMQEKEEHWKDWEDRRVVDSRGREEDITLLHLTGSARQLQVLGIPISIKASLFQCRRGYCLLIWI